MGRERQKKKNRSSRSTVRPKIPGRTKAGKKKVNFLGNETIAKNWDRSLTLEQNYKRLGLSTRLNAPTGGTEPSKIGSRKHKNPFAIKSSIKSGKVAPEEVEVERDPQTGHILRVIRPEEDTETNNPLHDPLNDLEANLDDAAEDNNQVNQNSIVAKLEAEAAQEEAHLLMKKQPRQQSTREEEWIAKLVEAHGDDTAAMFRDRKLNVMQQSEGDIARRVKKWKLKHG